MMCEYEDQSEAWWNVLESLNSICLWFFTVEMALKLIAYLPKKYIADDWSKFDAAVISLSWLAIFFDVSGAAAIRSLRALRIVLVLKSAKGMQALFRTLVLSIGPSSNICFLLLLVYALYALLGMMMFGNMPVQNVDCTMEGTPRGHDPSYCQWVEDDDLQLATSFSGLTKGKQGQVLQGMNRQYTHHSSFRNFGDAMALLFQVRLLLVIVRVRLQSYADYCFW